ncbi:NUDIX hydrolase [Paenibacillus selenitireducens]|uniref:NUDIX hydrolase n=2 Tax=Paenibacillus selenitireducens TaxID=1324314 RepID=A0A1T2X1W1_9BACL|nr:NUDIX domain-containing protein [Paenibacillus selenitireducens]OPA73852.1 NUDIX hydrolase [Paenibacillus selenitireducens]
MKPIRNSAKAMIIQDHRILLTKNRDEQGEYYLFPGGGQEKYEQLRETVQRECMEELGCEVDVKDIVYVREYIGKHHEFAAWDADFHQVEFYFECTMTTNVDVTQATQLDNDQIGVEWVEISRLHEVRVYPKTLVKNLQDEALKPCYIGDAN